MNALVLVLALTSTLVLRSGERIKVDGKPVEKDGVYTFRSEGTLYSLPAAEVERIETDTVKAAAEPEAKQEPKKLLTVSEEERKRLLAELEKNRAGKPIPPEQRPPQLPPPPTTTEVRERKADEASWRSEARAHEEAIRRANEELALLERRIEELRGKIQSLLSLGYKPNQFTYDTTELARAEKQIPYARLEIERATRAYDQFREDARREGVMPGWLR